MSKYCALDYCFLLYRSILCCIHIGHYIYISVHFSQASRYGGNEKIALIFEEMSVVQRLRRERFRSQAYAKAAQALRAHPEVIDSGAQAKGLKGIGAGMASRIDAARSALEIGDEVIIKDDS